MTTDLISFEEYTRASYEYDREWVDGKTVERNGGEFPHARCLSLLGAALFHSYPDFISLISVRVRTHPRIVRVPDIAVVQRNSPRERILTYPPLLVVEVVAPEDTMELLIEKTREYRQFGIEHVWVIDPYARVAYRGTQDGLELVRSGELTIPGTPIRVVPEELFAELDRV